MKIKLLSRQNLNRLIATNPTQHDYTTVNYYRPVIKTLYLKKVKVGLEFLGQKKYQHMLDVGFGGGVIIPELATHCQKLSGIDIHKNIELVKEVIANDGVNNVNLQHADIQSCQSDFFDCVWCMSVLEFVADSETMIKEIKRVTKSQAKIIFGFPLENKLTDFLYRLIGFKNKTAHQNNHQALIAQIKKHFSIEKIKYLPAWLPVGQRLFVVIEAIKIKNPPPL